MNKKRFALKALLTFMVALIILGTVSTFAYAGDSYQNKKLAYGEIVPTDAALKAQKFTYNFYGDKGDMYFMRLSKGVSNAYFAIELYSDKNYKNQIRSFTKEYDATAGNKSLKVTWEFKDKPSGTYYGRCYSYSLNKKNNKIIDSASMKTFKINVDRMSKKTVKLKTLTNSATGPKITWATFPTATKYKVYRREGASKKWTLIKTLGEKTSSYIDTTAKSGKKYSYTVKCLDEKYTSLYNKKGLTIYHLASPTVSVSGSGAAGNAKVQWKAIPGAKGYKIYRKGGTLSDYNWKLLATITNGKAVSYTDTTAKSTDWNYSYSVKAYNGDTDSARSRQDVAFDYIPAPELTNATCVDGGVKITWKANNPNITGYKIYKKDGTSWKYLGSSKTKEFTDTSALSGKSYTYMVKAHSDTNAGAFNSKGITKKYMKAPELLPLTFDSNYRSVVKWKPVAGANGYKIYRKVANDKSWTLIATIKNGKKSSYYDNYKKESGTAYSYTVRSYDSKNNLSAYKTPATKAICLFKPEFTANQLPAQDNSLCIEIKWNAVAGAKAYNLYRRLPGGKWSTLVKETKELSYLDTSVDCGVAYEYAVRALNKKGDISLYSVKSATAVAIPVLESVIVTEEGVKLNWNALENAQAYNVYRRAKGSNTLEKIATVETNEFTDVSEEAKTQPYYYTISAVFGDIESSTYDGLPNFAEFEVTALMVEATGDEEAYIDVTFDYPDADTISVFKSVNDEEAVLLPDIHGSFRDTEIVEGNTYTYKVVVTATGKVENTETATAKYNHPPLAPVVITSCVGNYNEGDPSVTLTWDKVEFADSYVIFRAKGNGEWVEIGGIASDEQSATVIFQPVSEDETPETAIPEVDTPEEDVPEEDVPEEDTSETNTITFVDTDVNAETVYAYKIKAIATKSERESSESQFTTVVIFTPLQSVTGIKFLPEKNEDGTINVIISWDETHLAQTYTVYRKTDSSDWQMLASIPAGNEYSYTDIVNINTNYTYKVVASADYRGSVSNEQTYCWSEPVVPSQPEGELPFTFVDENAYIAGNNIITTTLDINTIDALLTINEGYTVEVISTHQGKCGTGSTINIYKEGEVVGTYILIVKGDVNGDSMCDVLDATTVEKLVAGNEITGEIYIIAADMNNDNIITIEDYDTISKAE